MNVDLQLGVCGQGCQDDGLKFSQMVRIHQSQINSGTCMLCPDGRDGESNEFAAVVAQK